MTVFDSSGADYTRNRAHALWARLPAWAHNERLLFGGLIGALLCFKVADFFEDRAEGASSAALWADASDAVLPVLLLIYLWRYTPRALFKRNRTLETTVASQHVDLAHWRSKASQGTRGFTPHIEHQFKKWRLSMAEKEIALWLLRGVSLREIAAARHVSERTVRQQAVQVYNKAEVSGRAELAAHFLDELMQ